MARENRHIYQGNIDCVILPGYIVDVSCTVFHQFRKVASGTNDEIARFLRDKPQGGEYLAFDDGTGQQLDFDLRAVEFAQSLEHQTEPRGRGRPRLGVMAREVTLLPSHGDWLNVQPGGAPGALRKLVDAARRMERCLAEFRVRGVKTNLPFLMNLVTHSAFLEGECTTRFIDETPELFQLVRRKDRATKILTFIAETIVNGNPLVKQSPAVIPYDPAPVPQVDVGQPPPWRIAFPDVKAGRAMKRRRRPPLRLTEHPRPARLVNRRPALRALRRRLRPQVVVAGGAGQRLVGQWRRGRRCVGGGGGHADSCDRWRMPAERRSSHRAALPTALPACIVHQCRPSGRANSSVPQVAKNHAACPGWPPVITPTASPTTNRYAIIVGKAMNGCVHHGQPSCDRQSHSANTVSQPSSLVRAVSSETLSDSAVNTRKSRSRVGSPRSRNSAAVSAITSINVYA